MVIEYAYDAAGLRTQKKVTENGVTTTTDYFLHGKLLTHLTQGNDALHFYYDAQSRSQMVKYNGNYYSYQHNLQGDILAIVDRIGTVVVEYGYDAWGKPTGQPTTLSSSATPIGTAVALSKLNPFRYRGYQFDEETGLYYLRTRYYNPEWGRFLNEDSLIGKTGKLLSHNMFTYCANNAIVYADPDGQFHGIIMYGQLMVTSDGELTIEGQRMRDLNRVIKHIKSRVGKNQYAEGKDLSKRNDVKSGWSDCSSLTRWAFGRVFDVDIGETSSNQSKNNDYFVLIDDISGDNDKALHPPIEKMLPGDLIFFAAKPGNDDIGHVEVYLGNGMTVGHGSGIGPTIKESLETYIEFRITEGYGGYRSTRRWKLE